MKASGKQRAQETEAGSGEVPEHREEIINYLDVRTKSKEKR